MLALRLARSAHAAVQFRRLLVAAASAGTGFLLLCTLGYALGHPDASAAAMLRLAWCLVPIAATVQFAVAVARTDPATRPRPGLAAIGLGPGQLMILAAVSTALSCTLGSLVALLVFLHLRGGLTGLPFDGEAAGLLAANQPLPLPAVLTLLALVPVVASVAGAVVLRPRDLRPAGSAAGGRPGRLSGFGGYGRSSERVGFGVYGRFGARTDARADGAAENRDGTGGQDVAAPSGRGAAPETPGGHESPDEHARHTEHDGHASHGGHTEHAGHAGHAEHGGHAGRAGRGAQEGPGREVALDVPRRSAARADTGPAGPAGPASPAGPADPSAPAARDGGTADPRTPAGPRTSPDPHTRRTPRDPDGAAGSTGPTRSGGPALAQLAGPPLDPHHPLAPLPAPGALPWGAAVLAAGLAVEAYAGRTAPASGGPTLPGGFDGGSLGVLVGWVLTAIGLALAGPALTHLCGRLLQAVRPGALRLLAGRVLMEEATRIGRPLGVVCAVASGAYAMALLYTGTHPDAGPLTTLGALLVAGCSVATLLTAAVEARDARADTTAALLRIGAPPAALRAAAALRAGVLLAVLTPLTWAIAEIAALPLAR
ncbi:hypothetical protein ACFFS2_24950 [Streptomyces aurantiacus]|uniref:Uncharacterized protein n=1 Tax=Streptomyces aurantiacus TaxID=47760 RepID=A0A7G1P0P2_9ACTN|nr:hypothetical protein [Streptomyces aurantiacus]BCL27367.1 hypothetical protein GCM10017557_22260 [Streptomyces aurantiacus]